MQALGLKPLPGRKCGVGFGDVVEAGMQALGLEPLPGKECRAWVWNRRGTGKFTDFRGNKR